VAGTRVLMADGSSKPIEKVKPGDTVKATNAETGLTERQQVTAAITGSGDKSLIELTLVGAGSGGGGPPAEVTATAGHKFYSPDKGWIPAGELKVGDTLRDSDGRAATVAGTDEIASTTTVYNLTVNDTHTYYVRVGDTAVLVHNCGARVVDMAGKDIANPDALASRLLAHTNQALSEFSSGAIGYSPQDLLRIARRPSRANTIKGNILDARVKELAGMDPALKDLFSTPGGMPGPDWVNTGRSVPGVGWYDLTTARMWGQHVFDYAPGFGPGVGILWR
jgi:hypothetical protein